MAATVMAATVMAATVNRWPCERLAGQLTP